MTNEQPDQQLREFRSEQLRESIVDVIENLEPGWAEFIADTNTVAGRYNDGTYFVLDGGVVVNGLNRKDAIKITTKKLGAFDPDKYELSPCPLCASEAKLCGVQGAWWAHCTNEDECGISGPMRYNKREAVALWNRRTPTQNAPQAPVADWSYTGLARIGTSGGGFMAIDMYGEFPDGRPADGEYDIVLRLKRVGS